MGEIRVLLVDDHSVFTELFQYALEARPGFRCVGRARTARAAAEWAASGVFDAAIVDIRLPDGDGLDVARSLQTRRPAARVVALTAFPTGDLALRARELGIPLHAKDGSLAGILAELGSGPADQQLLALTAREQEVLELLAEGFDARTVARILSISLHTARGHVKSLLHKTGGRSQLEAVAISRRAGLLGAKTA